MIRRCGNACESWLRSDAASDIADWVGYSLARGISLAQARVTIDAWRDDYNYRRAHSSLGALSRGRSNDNRLYL